MVASLIFGMNEVRFRLSTCPLYFGRAMLVRGGYLHSVRPNVYAIDTQRARATTSVDKMGKPRINTDLLIFLQDLCSLV
jgi:hypothetical protein